MCIRICFLLSVLIYGSITYAQGTPGSLTVNGKWAPQIFIADLNGMPIRNQYPDVNGSPYYIPEYKSATITLKEGKVFSNVKMRIDMVAHETYFLSSNGTEGYVAMGMIKEISYADTGSEGIVLHKFQTGFPAIDQQTPFHFYQVLAEGKCSLLKSIIKKVAERKNELSGEIVKEFETYEGYYLFSKGNMKRLKKDKDFILAELSDKQVQVNQFILANKLNLKNNDHLVKLLSYYNSL